MKERVMVGSEAERTGMAARVQWRTWRYQTFRMIAVVLMAMGGTATSIGQTPDSGQVAGDSVGKTAGQRPKTSATEDSQLPQTVTFNQHVAPILFEKCAGCHRPGQAGPFPLLTYEQASERAQTILAVVEDQYMPPWKLVNHNLPMANDRRLSEGEKKILEKWVSTGKKEGAKEAQPKQPEFPDKWMLGEPDLVIRMKGQFQVPASGPDVYRSFVFPLQLDEERWVKAVELRPTARTSVHHALFFIDQEGTARQQDGQDGQAGLKGMSFLSVGGSVGATGPADNGSTTGSGSLLERLRNLGRPASSSNGRDRMGELDRALARGLGGYVPGSMPARLPDDLAMHLPAGSDIVMQTHFHPSGKPEVEEAELGLYFADQPPSQQLVPIQVPAVFGFGAGIDVPAGEPDFVVEDSFQLPVEVQAISVGGHAHYICREMSMVAELPDGEIRDLMVIKDWDLDWQDRYYFADRVTLPAGTILKTRLVYDNSDSNPENPHHPPQRIRWGRESNDEMGSVTLAVVAANEMDRPELESALRDYFRATVVDRFRNGKGMMLLLKQLDSNGDGMLQPEEAPPRLSRNFPLFDVNRDGVLDQEELKRVAEVAARLGGGSP